MIEAVGGVNSANVQRVPFKQGRCKMTLMEQFPGCEEWSFLSLVGDLKCSTPAFVKRNPGRVQEAMGYARVALKIIDPPALSPDFGVSEALAVSWKHMG